VDTFADRASKTPPTRLRAVTNFIVAQRESLLILLLLSSSLVMTYVSPIFLTQRNISSILLSAAIAGILAVGMMNLLVAGAFDLSIGSGVGFVGMATALLIKNGMTWPFAILAGLGLGVIIGLVNGVLITKLKINGLIVTLAGLSILRGLTFVISSGRNQTGFFPESFAAIGQAKILGLQSPIWIYAGFVILGDILLRRSNLFRRNYFIGGNEAGARLSGIDVDKMTIVNYVIMGFLTAVAGIVLTAQTGAATVTAGAGLELTVIAAAVIGGASLKGGEGTVLGSSLGVLLLVLITTILSLLGVAIYWQTFVSGAALLFAVLLDRAVDVYRERVVV